MVKEDLDTLRRLKLSINRVDEAEQRLRDTVTDISAKISGMPRSQGTDRMASYVARLEELQKGYIGLIIDYDILCDELKEELKQIPEQQARVLWLYYADGLSWKQVSKRMNLSESHIFRIRQTAMEKIFNKIDKIH